MDKTTAVKMLAGTIARGLMWAAAAVAAKYGVDTIGQSTVEGISLFIAAVAVSAVTAWWSAKKDKKLLLTEPPK